MKDPTLATSATARPKSRLLGQVKKETLQFSTMAHGKPLSPVYRHHNPLGDGIDGTWMPLRSMQELDENFRHTALLNIVANISNIPFLQESEARESHHQLPEQTAPSQSQKFPSYHALDIGGVTGPTAKGRTAQNGVPPSASLQQETPATYLLTPRPRSVSIPSKLHMTDLPNPIVSTSLMPEGFNKIDSGTSRAASEVEGQARNECDGANGSDLRLVFPGVSSRSISMKELLMSSVPIARSPWQAMDYHHQDGGASTATAASSNDGEDASRSQRPHKSPSASPITLSMPERSNAAFALRLAEGVRKANRSQTSNGQLLSHVRRHLAASRKRELLKRMTEVAKCDVVDMMDAVKVPQRSESVPPMIILSQMKEEIQPPDESTFHNFSYLPAASGDSEEKPESRDGCFHKRTPTKPTNLSQEWVKRPFTRTTCDLRRRYTRLRLGVPDWTQCLTRDPRLSDDKGTPVPEKSILNGGSQMMYGVVGRKLGRSNGIRVANDTRLSASSTLPYQSAAPTRRNAKSNRQGVREQSPKEVEESCPSPPYDQPSYQEEACPGGRMDGSFFLPRSTLPALSITGLSRDGHDVTTSRAARLVKQRRPVDVSSSTRLFQKIDDHCVKLQRQLLLTLNEVHHQGLLWKMQQQDSQKPTCLPASLPVASGDLRDVLATEAYSRRGEIELPDLDLARTGAPSNQNLAPQVAVLVCQEGYPETADSVATGGNFGGASVWIAGVSVTADNDILDEKGADPGNRPGEVEEDDCILEDGDGGCLEANSLSLTAGNDLLDRDGAGEAAGLKPVLQTVKEPRYQGCSSKVPDNQARSRIHYVNANHAELGQETLQNEYRILKALDQDVYHDFQHKKFRNSGSTTLPKLRSKKDQPRVHFYKVKVVETD